MATETSNIIRRAGDTIATKSTLKINGVPIDITDWNIELRYKLADDTVMVIDCVQSDSKSGKIMVFPHAREQSESQLAYEDYVSSDMIGDNIPGSDPVAQYTADDVNQVWDEDEANNEYPFYLVRWKEFGDYREENTHNVGMIQLLPRFLA